MVTDYQYYVGLLEAIRLEVPAGVSVFDQSALSGVVDFSKKMTSLYVIRGNDYITLGSENAADMHFQEWNILGIFKDINSGNLVESELDVRDSIIRVTRTYSQEGWNEIVYDSSGLDYSEPGVYQREYILRSSKLIYRENCNG